MSAYSGITDSSKFSEKGVVLQSKLNDISMVITDSNIPEEAKDDLEAKGIELRLV